MPQSLIDLIVSSDPAVRDRSIESFCLGLPAAALQQQCLELENFRRDEPNLYHRVRALFFLYALHRFHLPPGLAANSTGFLPFEGYDHLLHRRFEEAIAVFHRAGQDRGLTDALCSALAAAYHGLAFQTLADQVRRSVRSVRGNQWMFRIGHPADQPLRVRPELLARQGGDGAFPILRELTPVRMDLSHRAWSDIFFLGMDYPEGARVLNVSIDLGVRGRDPSPRPPIEVHLRVIDEPVLRLTSVDLNTTADVAELSDVFDFAQDYLGLLKAAVIASGIVPPGLEGSQQTLADLLARTVGPGLGLELISNVNGIPKGSRLAVSTNLLGALISVCMRATFQAKSLTGPLSEEERRVVAARAILGEWLGGSGGGWQDSGGVWPGIKLIEGVHAGPDDPEWGVSRGRLLPQHVVLDREAVSPAAREALQNSLVLVHGGLAQNVGPILEMVTEKYLLRSEREWHARRHAGELFDEILGSLKNADIRRLGDATTRNFFDALETIIPWATNAYTEALIHDARDNFGPDFWGFWMLGGMSGGGMGFIVNPRIHERAQDQLLDLMRRQKNRLHESLPFAMDPVVYDFRINEHGTVASLLEGDSAVLPPGYYALVVPLLLRADARSLSPLRRLELDRFGHACRVRPELQNMVQVLFDRLLPPLTSGESRSGNLFALLDELGFDSPQHEQIRQELKSGRIGLAQNRLPASTQIDDVQPGDVIDAESASAHRAIGERALANGEVAVVTLAGGIGSRWTQGAGVVKALHPFCKFSGRHRSFIELHLAKTRQTRRLFSARIPHIFTTSYLTHDALRRYVESELTGEDALHLSPGRAIGLRMVPMVRDLRFAWEETSQQVLDEQKQKVRDSQHAALIDWAARCGEASDYTDNLPFQCLHPVGHWYEVPNLLRNGQLARLYQETPRLRYLLLHNIDTTGAHLDPALLGAHIASGACLTFEVIRRRIEDRGGGLARVNGRVRLVEGLAMPRESDEFRLTFYNSMTTWIDLDALLDAFGLNRADLADPAKVARAIRSMAARMPTYVTLKDVKKRWGHGQEDVFPVTQFEKLWSDMTALPEISSRFVAVPRVRGQQLKDPAQLDGWVRDGSAEYVESLCDWNP